MQYSKICGVDLIKEVQLVNKDTHTHSCKAAKPGSTNSIQFAELHLQQWTCIKKSNSSNVDLQMRGRKVIASTIQYKDVKY